MESIRELFKENRIHLYLTNLFKEPSAEIWDLNTIINSISFYSELFDDNDRLEDIISFDDYLYYLVSYKIKTIESIIEYANDEHKPAISELIKKATNAIDSIDNGMLIKYINQNIETIMSEEGIGFQIHSCTLNFISMCSTGFNNDVYKYLCENFRQLIIERYQDFSKLFERKTTLFKILFPDKKYSLEELSRNIGGIDIWAFIMNREGSRLKNYVKNTLVQNLYNNITEIVENTDIDSAIILDVVVRKFNDFLNNIKSPLANSFSAYVVKTNELFSRYLEINGKSFTFDIPVKTIMDNIRKMDSLPYKFIGITHSGAIKDSSIDFVSRLSIEPSKEFSIIDLVSVNIPVDKYFTFSHQNQLSIVLSIGAVTIFTLMNDLELYNEFLIVTYNLVDFISQETNSEADHLTDDVELLLNMLNNVPRNMEKDNNSFQVLAYGICMFICAFIEKLLKVTYRFLVKDDVYVPMDRTHLRQVLSVNNKEMTEIFGENHLKNLSFYLIRDDKSGVGRNLRNRLAHWGDISRNELSVQLVDELMWIFEDVLNTLFWHFRKQKGIKIIDNSSNDEEPAPTNTDIPTENIE